jgi:hypothetical protein
LVKPASDISSSSSPPGVAAVAVVVQSNAH